MDLGLRPEAFCWLISIFNGWHISFQTAHRGNKIKVGEGMDRVVKYDFAVDSYCDMDNGAYQSYKINAFDSTCDQKNLLGSIKDVTTSRFLAGKIVKVLNANHVELIHFKDIVEDLLP